MFRAAHRSSSGALNCICSLWFIYPCGDRPLPRLSSLLTRLDIYPPALWLYLIVLILSTSRYCFNFTAWYLVLYADEYPIKSELSNFHYLCFKKTRYYRSSVVSLGFRSYLTENTGYHFFENH